MDNSGAYATAVDLDAFLASGQSLPAPLAALHALWNAKRGPRIAPARTDIDFLELRPWLGFLMLIEVIEGGRDFFYRVYGTTITTYYANDLTGKKLSEIEPAISGIVFPEYRTIVETRRPLYVTRRPRVWHIPGYDTVARLILPLSSDGRTVDQILVGFHAIETAP